MSQGKRPRGHATARAPRRKKKKREARAQAKSIADKKEAGEIPATHLVSMKELSRYLNVSRQTLWKMVHNGQVPHYRIGHQYRFDVVSVLAGWARFN